MITYTRWPDSKGLKIVNFRGWQSTYWRQHCASILISPMKSSYEHNILRISKPQRNRQTRITGQQYKCNLLFFLCCTQSDLSSTDDLTRRLTRHTSCPRSSWRQYTLTWADDLFHIRFYQEILRITATNLSYIMLFNISLYMTSCNINWC